MPTKERASARPRDDVPGERRNERNAPLRVVQPANDDDDQSVSIEGFKPLLPDGSSFEAVFLDYVTIFMFNAPKCIWEFKIVEPGDWFETRLFRPFRVRALNGRPSRRGKFSLHAGSDMYGTLVRLLDYKQRANRISLLPLKHMLFRVRVRTVCLNSRQEAIAEHAQYSVIDHIIRAE